MSSFFYDHIQTKGSKVKYNSEKEEDIKDKWEKGKQLDRERQKLKEEKCGKVDFFLNHQLPSLLALFLVFPPSSLLTVFRDNVWSK